MIARSKFKAYLGAVAMTGVLVLTMASGLLGAAAGAAVLLCRRIACHDRAAPLSLARILGESPLGGPAFARTPPVPGVAGTFRRGTCDWAGAWEAWPPLAVGRKLATPDARRYARPGTGRSIPDSSRGSTGIPRVRPDDRMGAAPGGGFAYARYHSGFFRSRYVAMLNAVTVLTFTALAYLWTQWRDHDGTAIKWLAMRGSVW